jgi:5-methylthioadenosine/S-adenosylhomocysteine deaminase
VTATERIRPAAVDTVVDTVLIGGEVVLRHKQLTSLDETELRSQVEAINRRVLGEIGIAPLPRWPIV